MKRTIAAIGALVLVVSACSSEPLGDSSTTSSSTTVTTSSLLPPLALEDQLLDLAAQVEEIRGLSTVMPPIVEVPAAEMLAGYGALHGLVRTGNDLVDRAFFTALGVLEPGGSISELEQFCAIPGFYDPATATLVMADDVSDLTPFGRRHLVIELVNAATDAAFDWSSRMAALQAAGEGEAAVGLWGLVRGDAAFHGSRYEQERLTSTDRFAIRLEEIACQQQGTPLPSYAVELTDYGDHAGEAFVETLVAAGGVPGLNATYSRPPATSEQIYHPPLYTADQLPIDVILDPVDASGFREVDAGVFGERMLRAVLSGGVGSAQMLQASTGWGGDYFRLLWDGSSVVLVLSFEGDEVRDARELAETFGAWAAESLRVGGGRPDNRGLAFEGEGYAFVAHDEAAMLLVVSDDAGAGRDVRNIFWPRW